MGTVTPEQLQRLLELQQRDTTLQKAEARVAELEEGRDVQRLKRELARLKTALADSRLRQSQRERAGHRNELEAESLRTERAQLEKRLYGGEITSTKEMEKLQGRIAHLGEQVGAAETAALENMEAAEAEAETVTRLERQCEDTRKRLDHLDARRRAELEECRQEAAAARGRRDQGAEGIDPDLLMHYRQLLQRLGGLAVVPVRAAACGGCDVGLSLVLLNRVKKMNAFYTCENCGRGLVWTGD